jgi:hypothetical protein
MKDPDPKKLRKEIKDLQARLEAKRNSLQQIVKRCRHDWGKTEYVPEHHKAYTLPGDPPGTMGVDRRGPCHVPARTDKKWQRVCKKCGATHFTSRTKMVGGGAGLKQEVPDFGD